MLRWGDAGGFRQRGMRASKSQKKASVQCVGHGCMLAFLRGLSEQGFVVQAGRFFSARCPYTALWGMRGWSGIKTCLAFCFLGF